MSKFISACIAIIPPTHLSAQDACSTVYASAVADSRVVFQNRSENAFYFNLFCESSGETKEISASGSLDVLFEGLPLGLSSDIASNEAKVQEFCRVGASENGYQSESLDFSRIIVTDALSSFNQCVALASNNLVLTHATTGLTRISINGTYTGGTNVRITSVDYDPNILNCTSTSFSDDGGQIVVDEKHELETNGEAFGITCERSKRTSTDGTEYYPPAFVTINTTEGQYTARMYADKFFGFHIASEANAAYDDAISQRDSEINARLQIASERDAIIRKFDTAAPTAEMLVRAQDPLYAAWGAHHLTCGVFQNPPNSVSVQQRAQQICGSRARVTGLEQIGSENYKTCGNTIYTFACMPIR